MPAKILQFKEQNFLWESVNWMMSNENRAEVMNHGVLIVDIFNVLKFSVN